MKLFVFITPLAFVNAFAPKSIVSRTISLSESKADLEDLGRKLNPLIGFYDPLNLTEAALWGTSNEFTIGWLRQSEVKHGRIAMAAFVGYIVQSNFHFPWAMTTSGMAFPSTDLSPPEQWDSLPLYSKLQIILFVGFLEFYSELSERPGSEAGQVHYTKGGPIGKYPSFDALPHPVPFNLYDPFGFSKKMSQETKQRRLRAEINNGRLAMIGIMGFLSETKIEGSVPALTGVIKPYAGEVMAPFSADFAF